MRRLVPAHRGARNCTEPECRKRYARSLFWLARAGVREGLADGILYVKMLTLTLPSSVQVEAEFVEHGWAYRGKLSGRKVDVEPYSEHAYRYMARGFNRFLTAARREWTFSYFRVVEVPAKKRYRDKTTGEFRWNKEQLHYHLLVMCRRFMPQRELSDLAVAAKLGEVVHITAALSDDEMSRYLTKYATKAAGRPIPRGLRFYAMSRNWASRSRASSKLRRQLEREDRRAEGWRFEYVREKDVAFVRARLAGTDGFAPGGPLERVATFPWLFTAGGPERVDRQPSLFDEADLARVEPEAAA